ncbi:MAG: hypothetical protein IJE91_01435 [Clostridia bacterium]|nr:hypothetical protein [Clostridia bacterium]
MNNELDVLTLIVKKEQFNTILENYMLLGWTLTEKTENNRYEDLLDVKLTRPHKIDNKDDLQLLQIYMEENLNEQAKLKKFKHAGSTTFSAIVGVLGLALMAFGILFATNVFQIVGLIGGIIMAVCGLVVLGLQGFGAIKLFKLERKKFETKQTNMQEQLKHLQKKARDFFGGENEK